MTLKASPMLVFAAILVCLMGSFPHFASALINCTYGDSMLGDSHCVEKYRDGAVCRPNGYCSNPFRKGCLRSVISEEENTFVRLRACNSDDDLEAETRNECVQGDYEEVRILAQDWEAPMITSWIMQILLSEVLGVPTTLETSMPDSEASMNFYDQDLRFSYSNNTYDYDSIRTSLKHGGCHAVRSHQEDHGWYRSCADVMPEAWNGQNYNIKGYVEEETIEPSTGSGGVAKFSWYVPKFTAANHYNILSHYGMKEGTDREERRRLAEMFLRPRKWKYFCENVSPDNCASPYYDEEGRLIAARPPQDDSEEGQFFKAGLYHGHFSASEDNDCDANPTNCTGHIASPPCTWTNYVVPQLHYLGIPVWSGGTETAAGNYNYGEMVGIYHAANYTKSNVLFYWFTPDLTVQEFMGSDAEFTPILLPQATVECAENRITEEQRCSDNPEDWLGEEAGSCDSESFPVQKLVVADMYNRTYDVDKAYRSPAYRFIKGFRLSDLQLELIYRRWHGANIDRWHYDNREAVCSWVGENIDMLKDFIPDTFPRTVRTSEYVNRTLVNALVLSTTTVILVLITAATTFFYRKKRVIVYAQPQFLYMLLAGVLLMSIGAFLGSLRPNSTICILGEWFTMIGYSFVLVPLIVKVAAINVLFQQSSKFRRVKISPKKLYKTIGGIIGLVVVFLTVWTIVDPFVKIFKKDLTGETNEYGGEVVEMYCLCSSQNSVWHIIQFVYVFLLIVAATVLAIQTRNVKQEFNESIRLGHVVYANFLIEILLVLVWAHGPEYAGTLQSNRAAAIKSCLLSANALFILAVYFVPKILSARKPLDIPQRWRSDFLQENQHSSLFLNSSSRAQQHDRSSKTLSAIANPSSHRNSSSSSFWKDQSCRNSHHPSSEKGFAGGFCKSCGRNLERGFVARNHSISNHPGDDQDLAVMVSVASVSRTRFDDESRDGTKSQNHHEEDEHNVASEDGDGNEEEIVFEKEELSSTHEGEEGQEDL